VSTPTFLFVSNSKYFHLTLLAIRSLLATNPVSKVLVYDIGFSNYERLVIGQISSLVEIISSGKSHTSSMNQDTGWVAAVGEKTQILSELVERGTHLPLVLADSDLVFLEDISDQIDPGSPIQVTKRARVQVRPDGNTLNYIASFLVVNSKTAGKYLKRWSEIMQELPNRMDPPFESYAQHLVTLEHLPTGAVGELEEDVVACDRGFIAGVTRVIHLKSMGPSNHREILLSRLRKVQHLPIDMNSVARKYLGWRYELLRIRAVIRRTQSKGFGWLVKTLMSK